MVKRRITVTIDEATFKALHLDTKNVSGYINGLLREEIVGSQREQLTAKLTKDLKDELIVNQFLIDAVADVVLRKMRGGDYD